MPDKPLGLEDERSLAEEVELAMGALRAEYRRAFLLFHEQQLSYQQIAEVLACPLGTVKTWVHRARREIVEQLTERGVVERSAAEVSGQERTRQENHQRCNVASLKTA
jgi:RNA polymerase sigma-70 factor (ECF subfamily)